MTPSYSTIFWFEIYDIEILFIAVVLDKQQTARGVFPRSPPGTTVGGW